MSSSIFNIGTSALNAAYTALRTTGNNIANVNTPGYSRQETVFTAQQGAFVGSGFVGRGVMVADVRRVYNDFLTSQAHQAQAGAAQSQTRSLQLAQVAALFADPESGIGANIDGFFRALQDLTQRPGDVAVRQNALSAGRLLADRFADVGARLQEMRNSTQRQLRLEADSVNRLTVEVADLNEKISLARGNGRVPNDLMDRRDNAIRRLNESVRVTTVAQDDGSINLFLGSGQPLVVGARPEALDLAPDPADPQVYLVGLKSGAGVLPLRPGQIGGGRIAGLVDFAALDLPQAENELGRLALTLATKFNEQHQLGSDRNGQPGGRFFDAISPSGFAARTNAGTGTVAVTVTDSTLLMASDYRIDFSGGNYTLTRVADGRTWTSAAPSFAQDGLTIALAGTPASGDFFTVQAVRNATRSFAVAAAQPTQIAAASPVKVTAPASNIGSLTVEDLVVLAPRNANVAQPATIDFALAGSVMQYTITAGGVTSAPQNYTAGVPIVFNGWSLSTRGAPSAGDSLAIGPNTGGVGDNRNAVRLAQLVDLPLVDGGKLGGAYAGIVARIGGQMQNAEAFQAAQEVMLEDALSAESAAVGVNLDEEASRLMQYQQHYQAAARMMQVASRVFDDILSLGR
jgi:flagellar hook-associated protein 1 FlgK